MSACILTAAEVDERLMLGAERPVTVLHFDRERVYQSHEALREQRDALVEALVRYGVHTNTCTSRFGHHVECNCGFRTVLAAVEEGTP